MIILNRKFKIGLVLQLVFYIIAFLSIIFIILYKVNRPSQFASLCFDIGEILAMVTALNPFGFIGLILMGKGSFNSYIRNSRAFRIYVEFALGLIVLVWFLTLLVYGLNGEGMEYFEITFV